MLSQVRVCMQPTSLINNSFMRSLSFSFKLTSMYILQEEDMVEGGGGSKE